MAATATPADFPILLQMVAADRRGYVADSFLEQATTYGTPAEKALIRRHAIPSHSLSGRIEAVIEALARELGVEIPELTPRS
ncbi:hypothetical protein OG455_41360 [Kitasatospora sp. NBC_01287]|uniref:hypothetical protein n=1 Tax=Kitasatospora sp. NBC_01287 TaxID=2903573 RepID=UPI00225C25DC|nr:hypothetical protein [Kitasatospora sp. NBC_01287]MCX4750932.1 hypothetical protein [Kitasatospora sp. NBC_01287]MCX4751817.1 hypothetical protein [Kitasatospora sp. NBC_01287]MCX4751891.1 hypothetical protein [Kitasatospora sp. NBC_01287]